MRSLEELVVPENEYIILRVDGVGFSKKIPQTYNRPYDPQFHVDMRMVLWALMNHFEALFGTTGSDECSIMLPTLYNKHNRRAEKLLSIASAAATRTFHKWDFMFDAKLFYTYSLDDAKEYFITRIKGVYANAISDLLYFYLAQKKSMSASRVHTATMGLSLPEREEALREMNVTLPDIAKICTLGHRTAYEKTGYNPIKKTNVTVLRHAYKTDSGSIANLKAIWDKGIESL